MNNKVIRISLGVLLAVFLFHQLYSSLYNPIKSESTQFVSLTDGIKANGIIIRSEKLINRPSEGVMHFHLPNGSRVAKGGVVADIYSNQNDSVKVNKIETLKTKIENIERIQGYNDIAAVDINLLDQKINTSFSSILFASSKNDFETAYSDTNDFLAMLNRKTMITGENYDFTAELNNLRQELSGLEASLGTPVSRVMAESSGFFVPNADGYENVLTTDDFSVYTPEFMDSLKSESVSGSNVGKIVSDYTWYFAAEINDEQSLKYKVGDRVNLHTSLKNNADLSVLVAAINKSKNNDRVIIIFSCQEMNEELASMRTLSVSVVDGIYEGLKVKKSALRVVDGERGVFVISGMELKFVKVKVIYSKEELDYAICEKADNPNSTVLRLYDKVVVKGKNLYDGKIIN